MPWYFRDYVDLDTGQRQQLERSVDTLLLWHRESQVGRYATFLRELEAEAARPLGRDRLEAARLVLEGFWDDIARQVAPDVAALFSTMSDAQVEALFVRIAEDDRELAREVLARSGEERIERRERALRRQLERWVGKLDPAQRAMVAECAGEMRVQPAGWLASRKRWQQALREALAGRRDGPAFAVALERLLADGDSFWPADYRQQFQADRDRVLRLIADVDASLDAAQRQRLRRQLGGWALDLESIAGGA